jgi:hypothetical protein
MVELYRQRKTSDSSSRALWQSYQQSPSNKQEELAKGIMNIALRSILFILIKLFYTCLKILRHGASGFTSPQKESVLRIFIALKNSSLQPGLDPWTLGRFSSTLTITPPRRHVLDDKLRSCRMKFSSSTPEDPSRDSWRRCSKHWARKVITRSRRWKCTAVMRMTRIWDVPYSSLAWITS